MAFNTGVALLLAGCAGIPTQVRSDDVHKPWCTNDGNSNECSAARPAWCSREASLCDLVGQSVHMKSDAVTYECDYMGNLLKKVCLAPAVGGWHSGPGSSPYVGGRDFHVRRVLYIDEIDTDKAMIEIREQASGQVYWADQYWALFEGISAPR